MAQELRGRAAELHREAEERRARLAEWETGFRAAAAGMVKLAARVTGLPGPDAIRQIAGDREQALALLALAGYDRDQIGGNWQAAHPAPIPAQHSVQLAGWGPDHDPRVTGAILAGASDAELAKVRREVWEEDRERAAGRARRETGPELLWETADGRKVYANATGAALGVSTGGTGIPQQRSAVNRSVPELGSEPVTGRPGALSVAVSAARQRELEERQQAASAAVRETLAAQQSCGHDGYAGRNFCGRCGSPLAAEVNR